jgi:hypothetical protein
VSTPSIRTKPQLHILLVASTGVCNTTVFVVIVGCAGRAGTVLDLSRPSSAPRYSNYSYRIRHRTVF